jgi:hypothetical protein
MSSIANANTIADRLFLQADHAAERLFRSGPANAATAWAKALFTAFAMLEARDNARPGVDIDATRALIADSLADHKTKAPALLLKPLSAACADRPELVAAMKTFSDAATLDVNHYREAIIRLLNDARNTRPS